MSLPFVKFVTVNHKYLELLANFVIYVVNLNFSMIFTNLPLVNMVDTIFAKYVD